jgi:hypothetical protein
MTKKSAGRLMRDKVKKDNKKKSKEEPITNTCWDDLNSMYDSMRNLLASHAHLSQLAATPGLIDNVEDKAELSNNFKILANDLTLLNDKLTEIHNLHSDKTGGTTDPDEFIKTIGIFEQYNLFMERHDGVVMPTAYYIIEQFDKAEKLLIKKLKETSDITDPNVISDAEIINETSVTELQNETNNDSLNTKEIVNTDISDNLPLNDVRVVPAPDFVKLKESFDNLHPELNNTVKD